MKLGVCAIIQKRAVKTDPHAKTPSRKEKLIRYKLVHRLHGFHRLKAVLMAWGQKDEKFGFCSRSAFICVICGSIIVFSRLVFVPV